MKLLWLKELYIFFFLIKAPKSMKSSTAAISLSTIALGNLLVVIISTISIKNQVFNYYFILIMKFILNRFCF